MRSREASLAAALASCFVCRMMRIIHDLQSCAVMPCTTPWTSAHTKLAAQRFLLNSVIRAVKTKSLVAATSLADVVPH